MGQGLVGTCCASPVQLNEQQVLTHIDFSKALFAPGDGFAALPSKTNATSSIANLRYVTDQDSPEYADVRDALIVSEVTGIVESPCAATCFRPENRQPLDRPLAEDYCGSPRFCSSPRSSKECEWNSAALLLDLNAQGQRWSLEFVPAPAASPCYNYVAMSSFRQEHKDVQRFDFLSAALR